MSRRTCAFALMVLTLALTLVPGVYAEYPIDDLEVVQDLPETLVAGNSYEMVILFDNIAKEPVTFYVNITVSCDEPLGFGEILVDEIELNEVDLACVETEPGIFSTPAGGTIGAMSRNRLDITISIVANLMPGAYIFEIDLMGKEMEPKPGPKHVIGRPNAEPKADAGPNQKAWVGHTVYFNGSKSEDPDGIIESYEWDFGDGTNASGVAVEHEYSEPGQYTVTLTVRDDRWAYDSDTCKIKVSEPPTTVSAEFAERVLGKKKGHVVNAFEEANTTVTLNTTDQVTVTVLKYEDNPYPEDPIPASALPTYVDVEVSDPDAVEWPIYVEIFYTDEEVEGLDEESLGIYYWDGAWQRCSDTGVNTYTNVVWAYMTAKEASGSPILIAGMHAIPTPPLPPFFSYLNITPAQLELGDNVTISFVIRNPNDRSISYGVDMRIENVNDPPPTWPPYDVTLRIWVELEAYELKTVSYNLTMDAGGDFNVTVIGMTGSFKVGTWPPLRLADFVISDLTITPEEIEEGEAVTVSVDVTNVGETEGSYTVELVMDGFVVGSEEITPLGGGMTATVVFELTRGEGTYQVEVDGLTGSFTVKAPPKPAEFEVTDLEITPEEVEEGEEVTITLKVSNLGDEEGTHTIELRIDGSLEESKTVTLPGGGEEEISFEVTRDEGSYQVETGGLTGEFTVTVPPGPPPLTPGYFSGIVILIVVAAVVIIYLYMERKGPPRLPPGGAAQS